MFVMQTSAMKACFQIAECSFSYAKLSNISVTSKYLNEINIIIDERWRIDPCRFPSAGDNTEEKSLIPLEKAGWEI